MSKSEEKIDVRKKIIDNRRKIDSTNYLLTDYFAWVIGKPA
jgi:hypothetical protein